MDVGPRAVWGTGLLLVVLLLLAPLHSLYGQAPNPPVPGDWLISHLLSDPENLNPLTSNDAASSRILNDIFESLLTRHPQTLSCVPTWQWHGPRSATTN